MCDILYNNIELHYNNIELHYKGKPFWGSFN